MTKETQHYMALSLQLNCPTINGLSVEDSRNSMMKTIEPTRPCFYGRRRGRPLRRGLQALLVNMLPDLRFDATRPLAKQFGQTKSQQADLVLEIGFGGGEHLAGLAEANPAVEVLSANIYSFTRRPSLIYERS